MENSYTVGPGGSEEEKWSAKIVTFFDCHMKGDPEACKQVNNCSAPLKQCMNRTVQQVNETCSSDFEDWLGRPVYRFSQFNESIGIEGYDMFVNEDSKRVCRQK
jgi:hypothetical protein